MKKLLLVLVLLVLPLISAQSFLIKNINNCRSNVTFTVTSSQVVDVNEYNITPNCFGDTISNVWVCECFGGGYYLNTLINTVNKYNVNIYYVTNITKKSSGSSGGGGGGGSFNFSSNINKTINNISNNISNIINNTIDDVVVSVSSTNITITPPPPLIVSAGNVVVNTSINNSTVTQPLNIVLSFIKPFIVVVFVVVFIFLMFKRKKSKNLSNSKVVSSSDEIQRLYNDVNDIFVAPSKEVQDKMKNGIINMSFCKFCNKHTKDIKSYVSSDKRCAVCGGFKKV